MGIKMTVAENALALIKRRAGGLKPNETSGVSRLKKLGLSHGVAQRLVMDGENVYISTLDVLAAGLDVQPWQLLVPGLDPDALPALYPPVASFSSELSERLHALDEEQLRRVENAVRGILDMEPLPRAAGFPKPTGAETPAQKSTRGLPPPIENEPEDDRRLSAERRLLARRHRA